MRFNKHLQAIANAYRSEFLGSTDEKDRVQRPDVWIHEKVSFRLLFACLNLN